MARVVLVDDDESGRHQLRAELEQLGHEVDEAADSASALTAVRRGSTALVVTTIFMPQREGLEVIRLLQHEQPALPIIGVSATPWAEGPAPREAGRGAFAADVVQLARESGATWVLKSPFDWSEFRDAVAIVLAHRQRRRARGSPGP
jgi:CheY-like chemotaxis protein